MDHGSDSSRLLLECFDISLYQLEILHFSESFCVLKSLTLTLDDGHCRRGNSYGITVRALTIPQKSTTYSVLGTGRSYVREGHSPRSPTPSRGNSQFQQKSRYLSVGMKGCQANPIDPTRTHQTGVVCSTFHYPHAMTPVVKLLRSDKTPTKPRRCQCTFRRLPLENAHATLSHGLLQLLRYSTPSKCNGGPTRFKCRKATLAECTLVLIALSICQFVVHTCYLDHRSPQAHSTICFTYMNYLSPRHTNGRVLGV